MTGEHTSISQRTKGLCVLLAAVPFAFLCLVVWRYYFRFPFSDEWTLTGLLGAYYDGTLTLGDLWASYHGHRLFVAYAIMVPLAIATHWSQGAEVVVNIVLGLAIFALVVAMVARSQRLLGKPFPWGLLPILSLLIFGLNQWCNWAWGWQMLVYLSVFCSVLSLYALGCTPLRWWHLCGALVAGVAASYSFGTGMMVWGAGLVLLLWPLTARERVPWRFVAAWCVVAAVVWFFFLTGHEYTTSEETPNPTTTNPITLFGYVSAYIGANPAYFRRTWLSVPVGIPALGAAAGLLVWTMQRKDVPAVAVAPFAGLMACVLSGALLTGYGRAFQYGIEQATVARYTTNSMVFWAALLYLAVVFAQTPGFGLRSRPVVWCALTVLCAGWLLGTRQGYYDLNEHYKVYTPEVRRFVLDELDEPPARLNPTKGSLAAETAILKAHGLSCFRPDAIAKFRDGLGTTTVEQ